MVIDTIIMFEVQISSGSLDIGITRKQDRQTDIQTDGEQKNMMFLAPPLLGEGITIRSENYGWMRKLIPKSLPEGLQQMKIAYYPEVRRFVEHLGSFF